MKLTIRPFQKGDFPLGLVLSCVTLVYGGLLWLLLPFLPAWMKTCRFRKIFHLPCPTCGSTRGILAFIRGNLLEAWHFNPFILTLILLLFTWGLYSLIFEVGARKKLVVLLTSWEKRFLRFFILLAFLANWIYLIRHSI